MKIYQENSKMNPFSFLSQLVEAHYRKDNEAFTQIVYRLYDELYNEGNESLAEHILSQTTENDRIFPCDYKPFSVEANGWCIGTPVDRGMYIVAKKRGKGSFTYVLTYWNGEGFSFMDEEAVAWKRIEIYREGKDD